jgi:hypothetical protein
MKKSLVSLLSLLLTTAAVFAQPKMGGAPGSPSTGVEAAMVKLFGKTTAFSATTEIVVTGRGNDATMIAQTAMLDGNVRTELDMTKMKSAQMPPNAAQSMAQMGMGKIVTIALAKENKVLMIYPGLEAYVEMPTDKLAESAADKEPKIEKTPMGEETIDGRKTTKNKVVITDSANRQQTFFTWNAPDLKDFPVRLQTEEDGSKIVMTYRDIKTEKPDKSLFTVPDTYTKHANYMALMQAAAMRMMGGAGK